MVGARLLRRNVLVSMTCLTAYNLRAYRPVGQLGRPNTHCRDHALQRGVVTFNSTV